MSPTLHSIRERVMKKLTKRQEQVFSYILECIQKRGRPPTIREIGSHLGISSTNGVRDHLLALRRKGYLMETPKGQGIEVAPEFRQDNDIPIIGQVPAGTQMLAVENYEGSLLEELVGSSNDEVFALRVKGQSMIEAGINDGDYVLVRLNDHVEQGEIGVAYIGEDATVKRIYREKDCFRLQPENSAMDPIIVTDQEEFRIAGKVIGVVRKIQ